MNCKECQVEIDELVGEKLRIEFSQSANSHIKSCPACATFREERTTLNLLIGNLEIVEAPADFDFRLRARLAAMKGERAARVGWAAFAPGGWSLVVAAALVAVLALGLFARQLWRFPGAEPGSKEFVAGPGVNNGTTENKAKESPSIQENGSAIDVDRPPLENTTTAAALKQRSTGGAKRLVSNNGKRVPDNRDEVLVSDFTNFPANKSTMPPGIPDPLTFKGATVAVPVEASLRPATVTLEDGSATPRTLSIRPITFGAQGLFEQSPSNMTNVSTGQGIW